MNCLNPTYIKSPESRLLRKCLAENRPWPYYVSQSNLRRNLLLDPVPFCRDEQDYYALFREDVQVPVRYQKVPCGHCDNCIKRKVNDYFVRNYFEYIDVSETGSSWLVTLTYSNDLLPRLTDGTPCFDSEDIKLFLKRFRMNCERRQLSIGGLRYFIVTEFGGELGRPHYHGIFHFSNFGKSVSEQFILVEELAKAWTPVALRKPYYSNDDIGLFDCQRVDARPITDTKGLQYVCKYVGKQIGAEDFDASCLDPRFGRFHRQSIGLGDCITSYCDPAEFQQGFVTIEGRKYSIPLGIQTKLKREFLCFHENGSIIYQPSCFARDSVCNFTFLRLEEYKELALINKDFPKPSPLLLDVHNLNLLRDFLDKYNGLDFESDFSFLDPARGDDLSAVVNAVQDFFNAVDAYYKPKYKASGLAYIKRCQDAYLRKKNMK